MPAVGTAKQILGVVGLVALLTGCATAAQREAQTIVHNNRSAVEQLKACVLQVYSSPDFALLRRHIPLSGDPTLEQLNDPSLATPAEIKEILTEHPKVQVCRQQFVSAVSRATPTIAAIWADAFMRNDDNLLDTINRKQSWGEAVRRARELMAETRSRLLAEAGRIRSGLSQEHEAELAHRQAALDAIARWAQTQQMINAMSRPVITSCNQFSGMVSCVSR